MFNLQLQNDLGFSQGARGLAGQDTQGQRGRLQFQVEARAPGTKARAGRFRTLHNEVQTPVFMPVGTHAAVRSQPISGLLELGPPVLLANTYHLLLRPGPEIFKKFGGIHGFMKWPRSVLTDSGGFQIFCLNESRQMSEEGASFRSYIDGQKIMLSPEQSIAMQRAIGSDIMMVLDECVPSTVEHERAREAMELTHRWALRSLAARGDSPQSMFGIVQGACFIDLRRQSADFLTQQAFDGFAIGGLAVGETAAQREDMTEFTAELLPQNLPRYLMGVGTPLDLLSAVHRGVDMFDCILPTAMAQQGVVFTWSGRKDLRRGRYKFVDEPIDAECPCSTCKNNSIAYLHHLIKIHDLVGWQLLAYHNIYFYMRLMERMRQEIFAGTFADFYNIYRERLGVGDGPGIQPQYGKNAAKRREAEADGQAQAQADRVSAVARGRTVGRYEVIEREGYASIRDSISGEIMHSVNNPAEEAHGLYVEQIGFEKFFAARHIDDKEPITLWDVGLGSAYNAMAAIRAYESAEAAVEKTGGKLRPLRLESFEWDLDSLRIVLKHSKMFPHIHHGGPHKLLQHGKWQSKNGAIEWRLHEGDFCKLRHNAPAPDLIYFDPFSFRTETQLWQPESFAELSQICGDRATLLVTYSRSTAVRAAILAGGFYVAKGAGSGPKSETTLAVSANGYQSFQDLQYLDLRWLQRWEASQSKYPASILARQASQDNTAVQDFEHSVRCHPQFRIEGGFDAPSQSISDVSRVSDRPNT